MNLRHFRSLTATLHLSIYLGPCAFLIGSIVALIGELSGHPELIFIGLALGAAGLIVWGCHGIRRRGARPGFLIMSGLGSCFLLLHLYYRYSDYRWAKLNIMTIGTATSATLTHLEDRFVLLICILLASAIIGVLPPLPSVNRHRKSLNSDEPA